MAPQNVSKQKLIKVQNMELTSEDAILSSMELLLSFQRI